MAVQHALKMIKYGSTRIVLLIGQYAIKVPTVVEWRLFLLGLLANLQEVKFSRTQWPKLCPVVFSVPLGILLVMRRATPLSRQEFDDFDFDAFVETDEYVVPVENKLDSFGWLNGRIVAVDYGN